MVDIIMSKAFLYNWPFLLFFIVRLHPFIFHVVIERRTVNEVRLYLTKSFISLLGILTLMTLGC